MKNVIVVNAASSGQNYIKDLINWGYNPIILWTKLNKKSNPVFYKEREELIEKLKNFVTTIFEENSYKKTLCTVKNFKPIAIVAGHDQGTYLCSRLSTDLKLPGLDFQKIKQYVEKYYMQQALKKAGLRYIKSKVVNNVEDAVKFYKNNKLNKCIIKPIAGGSGNGMHVCNNISVLKKHLKEEFNLCNYYGVKNNQMIVQEFIDGKEYVINTFSYKQKHVVTSIWKYEKQIVDNGGKAYDLTCSVHDYDIGISQLLKYALKVLDALDMKYGPIHGEYMVDENGPVLIEVNCRIMGGSQPSTYLDLVWGHHETNVVLDYYLKKTEEFDSFIEVKRSMQHAIYKRIISRNEHRYKSVPLLSISRRLKSFYKAHISTINNTIVKTIDLGTTPATIYLLNNDIDQVTKDARFLQKIESEYFYMLFEILEPNIKNSPKNKISYKYIYNKFCALCKTFIYDKNNHGLKNIRTVNNTSLQSLEHNYDYCIFNLEYDPNRNLEEFCEAFYAASDHLSTGGKILVPIQSYWYLPYGIRFLEVLCLAAGYKIDPDFTLEDGMFSSMKL